MSSRPWQLKVNQTHSWVTANEKKEPVKVFVGLLKHLLVWLLLRRWCMLFLGRAWNVLGVKKCHPSGMIHIKSYFWQRFCSTQIADLAPNSLLLTEILQYPNHRFGPKSLTGTMILKRACQTCCRFTKILIVKPGADSLDSLDFRSDKSTKTLPTHNEIMENGSHVNTIYKFWWDWIAEIFITNYFNSSHIIKVLFFFFFPNFVR